jgi:hypothetical protein
VNLAMRCWVMPAPLLARSRLRAIAARAAEMPLDGSPWNAEVELEGRSASTELRFDLSTDLSVSPSPSGRLRLLIILPGKFLAAPIKLTGW